MMNFLQLDTFTKIFSILSDFVKSSERATMNASSFLEIVQKRFTFLIHEKKLA